MMMRSVAAACACAGEAPKVDGGAAAADAAVVMGGAIDATPEAGVIALLAFALLVEAADALRAGPLSPEDVRCWLANKSAKGSDGVPKRDAGGGVGVAVIDGALRAVLPPPCKRSLIKASSGSAARVG